MEKEIKDAVDAVGKAFHEYKQANDARIAEIAKRGEATDETVAKVMRLEKAMEEGQELKSRLEKLEISMKRRLEAHRDVDALPDDQKKHLDTFVAFMRNPKDHKAAAEYQQATRELDNVKAVEVATPGLGGYAVPEVLSRTIERKGIELSPMRQLVQVQKASSTDFKLLLDVGGATSGWVGEKAARTETDTPTLREIAPTFGMLYAYPKATEESLQDMFFDVVGWLADSVAESFAYEEGRAILSGNGTNKPTGMLGGVMPDSEDDGSTRTAGAYQFLKTGAATSFPTDETQADPLLNLIYKLRARYRANAKWLMNRNTMATVRRFKDADGNYLWVPGITAGATDRLMGYNVVEVEGLADIGADAFPVMFGDFRAGYLLADLVGLRVTPDEITTPGYVKWYFRKRLGGIKYNDDAVKVLKVAA